MRGKRTAAWSVLLLALAATTAGALATQLTYVSVHVPRHPSVAGKLKISFKPHGQLPRGGYYYAVAVLTSYPRRSATEQPPCAVSSDMEKTEYGYPRRDRVVRLALIPAKSVDGRWCAGTYTGAIYAVPHKPPCSDSYLCYGKDASGSCWEQEGNYVCGEVAPKEGRAEREAREKAERESKEKAEHEAESKVKAEREARERAEREAKEKTSLEEREKAERESKGTPSYPPYSYPRGLPKPIDRSTRIVGYFQVTF